MVFKPSRAYKVFWVVITGMLLGLYTQTAVAASQRQPLLVEGILPQGQVQRITQIVASFNKDMVPLGQSRVEPGKAPLRISPSIKGSYRWLDTRTIGFFPQTPLTGATRIKITVPAGVKALDGSRLAKPHYAAITTPRIKITQIYPKPGKVLGPKFRISLTFNQPIELASLIEKTRLLLNGQAINTRIKLASVSQRQNTSLRLARRYYVSSDQKLPPRAELVLAIKPGLRPALGDMPTTGALRLKYPSYQGLTLKSWGMDQGYGKGSDPDSPLQLKFNNPVSAREVWKYLEIEPGVMAPAGGLSKYPSKNVWLYLNFMPRTRYEIRLKPGLTDSYGTSLAKGFSLYQQTGDMWPSLNLPQGNGVLEMSETPRVLVRARNLDNFTASLRRFEPRDAVPALVAEADRPWDHKPKPPRAGAPGVVVTKPDLRLRPNERTSRVLDLNQLYGAPVKGGLVLLDLRSTWPDRKGKPRQRIRRSFLQVTNLGLSLKLASQEGLAWVTDLKSGTPLAGAELELRDRANQVLWRGVSDENGLARLPGVNRLNPVKNKKHPWRDPQVFLLATYQDDFALLPSTWGDELSYSLPYEINVARPGKQSTLKAHGLFQLPLYQPGQTVRFLAYVRKPGQGEKAVPAGLKLSAVISDAANKKVHSFSGVTNRYGTVSGSFKLAKRARLGRYELTINTRSGKLYAGGFRVASFRPPDFKVSLNAPQSSFGNASMGKMELRSDYMFGKPVAHGKARVRFQQEPSYFRPESLKDYAVGDLPMPGQEPNLHASLGELSLNLDAEGLAKVNLPAAKTRPGHPVRVRINGEVRDASGRVQSGKSSVMVHPSKIYLGIKTPLMTTAKTPVKIEMASAKPDGEPITPKLVHVKVYRQYWETVREKGPGGFFRYLGKVRRDLVWSKDLAPDGPELSFEFTPPQSGSYVITASAKDQAGRENLSAAYCWASGKGIAGWQRHDDHRLEMVAESSSLRPGQTARLLIKNPFAKALALISVEREGVLRHLVQTVEGPSPVIQLPLKESDAPGVYVGVLLVRGRAGEPKKGGPDLGRPQVRIGYSLIKVQKTDPGLSVRVIPQEKLLRPGAKARVSVEISHNGKPSKSQITLLAVDERVLTAAGGTGGYDPRPAFSRMPPLSVFNADLRSRVIGKLEANQKGADEAGGGGLGQGVRQRFHPSVYWLAQAESDANGLLETSFTLPDSLTSYRVVAVAADQANRFGLGQANIQARQPLQILSALPRFAVKGDEFSARAVVQNLGDQPGKVKISLHAGGVELLSDPERELLLASGESKAVGFKVKASSTGKAWFQFTAGLGEFKDAARFGLDVIPASRLQTMAAAGMLNPGGGQAKRVLPLKMPAGADPGRGGLKLRLAPSLGARLDRPLDSLLAYPWNCLEQRISRAAAKAFLLSVGPKLGLKAPAGAGADLEALAMRLPEFQYHSGGFTYWPGAGKADQFLTAYVLLAATHMKQAGFNPPASVLKKAEKYLVRSLNRGAPNERNLAARTAEALSIWALSLRGEDMRSHLESALLRAKGLSPFGLSALIQAAGHYHMPKAVQELITRLEASASISAESLHFATVRPGGLKIVMGSTLRGNAAALWAMCRHSHEYAQVHKLAKWVADTMSAKPYISTQDAVFGIWGIGAYLLRFPGDKGVRFKLALGSAGEPISHSFASGKDAPISIEIKPKRIKPGEDNLLSLQAFGQGRLYWSSRLVHAPLNPMGEQVNQGFSVSREIIRTDGKDTPLELGDEVDYRITLLNSHTRHHVVVDAPYPACLEPIGAAGGRPIGGSQGGPWGWRELRRTGLVLYAKYLRPGLYVYKFKLRAVAPGRFITPAARAEEMYSPEVHGSSAGLVVQVQ
jgi:uncharacterized protein YfaS (alpha-2-macroglobulin family)